MPDELIRVKILFVSGAQDWDGYVRKSQGTDFVDQWRKAVEQDKRSIFYLDFFHSLQDRSGERRPVPLLQILAPIFPNGEIKVEPPPAPRKKRR